MKGLSLLMVATLVAPNVFAKEGDSRREVRQSVIGTSIVDVNDCQITPNLNLNGGYYTSAQVSYLKCEEIETYDVQVTEAGAWESDNVSRIAGSERRSYRLVSDVERFSDINSAINNGQDTYVDSDLNGDGKITKGERRRANDIRQDEAVADALGDLARASVGTMQVQAQCNNFVSQLRLQQRSNGNLPIECRR